MPVLYNAYDNKIVGSFSSEDELKRWIGTRAQNWNYGICREWTINEKHFFDVGPRVFYVIEK